jgi:putative oxygen-independent coproporphyrinogen III oxidase
MNSIPLSLYIHIPWCVKKCPYCDFNSHALKNVLPETEYLNALIEDLQVDLPYVQQRPIKSIFFGGGTPSLISPQGIESLLNRISKLVTFAPDIEITLETNPGTVEHFNLADYKTAGINRISLGAQSFDDQKLKLLGRIHCAAETLAAIDKLHKVNFNSFNIDLMHGLPQQTLEQAIQDLTTALDCKPPHLSWYQLTIEPNTFFYKYPPALPSDDLTWQIQTAGEQLLATAGLQHYEVSAFAQPGNLCKHNINYWEFGDYLGIGAGAHGKITNLKTFDIQRTWKTRTPTDYLNPDKQFLAGLNTIAKDQLPSEYMLNRLRLFTPLNITQYQQYTGLPSNNIAKILNAACQQDLLLQSNHCYTLTHLGKRFLNNVVEMFLTEEVLHD